MSGGGGCTHAVGMISGVVDDWTLVKLGNIHTHNDKTWEIIIVEFVALYLLKCLKQLMPCAFPPPILSLLV